MVKIRLSRGGSKKRPFYHIVAADERDSRDGRYLERLGFFNPIAKGDEEALRIDMDRVTYWQETGAQLTDRVAELVKTHKKQDAQAA